MDSETALPRVPCPVREPGLPRSSHHYGETIPEGHRDGIGVLEVVNKTLTQAHYTEEDLKNLETLASPRAPSGNRDYPAPCWSRDYPAGSDCHPEHPPDEQGAALLGLNDPT